jgi:hypothetical protein
MLALAVVPSVAALALSLLALQWRLQARNPLDRLADLTGS